MTEDDLINLIPLDDKTNDIANKIVEEDDLEETKKLINLFNLHQAKKNVLRVLKFNSLLDKVSDQMLARFEKCPGEFSNGDLINYLTVTQNAIDRANKSIALVDETPMIQFNQVNIANPEQSLSRESKENIIKAVQALMTKAKELNLESDNTIEGEIVKENKDGDIQGTDK